MFIEEISTLEKSQSASERESSKAQYYQILYSVSSDRWDNEKVFEIILDIFSQVKIIIDKKSCAYCLNEAT